MNIINISNLYKKKSIIVTPYEKVLSILDETMKVLNLSSKVNSKLFSDLLWVIKTIKSHSIYSYEIKEKNYVEELSKYDPDFKQFVNFVNEYNEEVIEMNKKNDFISNELLQKPSFKLKKKLFINNRNNNNLNPKRASSNDKFKNNKITINCLNHVLTESKPITDCNIYITDGRVYSKKALNIPTQPDNKSKNNNNKGKLGIISSCKSNSFNRAKNIEPIKNSKYMLNNIKLFRSYGVNKNNLVVENLNRIGKMLQGNQKKNFFENKKESNTDSLNKYSNLYIDHLLTQYNYDQKRITEKDFDIFELKSIIGQNNVLPLIGKVILETFGLKDEKIINVDKLDLFLNSISKQYLNTTLYHNNMHGADVTQTICLFFLNSNAEKMFQTTVLDLLSIIISALGHDVGHPGLTNNFHINARTELAITYNDASCLENYHCCKLFSTLQKDETNIFEKLSVNDYKGIRKRMISEILSTDMFYHKQIMSNIQEKLSQLKNGNFEFINKDDIDSVKKEQQVFLDYFIHSADLAHNTKLFNISLKWVQLLSEEFWLQGDKEKSMGLSVSFLCDRKDVNVPLSQVNFIKGFILPTFEILVTFFPSLSYTTENANNNINEWQKLVDAKRMKGWTPRNKKEKEKSDKNIFDNCILRANVNKWNPEKINLK